MSWPIKSVPELLSDDTGGNSKIKQSDYLEIGQFPIIDQGRDLIGGYTNDASNLCAGDLPVIIFGDHTKHLKYIDFPFCLGADGTKVLRAKKGVDPKFLYYALQTIYIPDAGYSRHFKYLKDGQIPLPPLEEQKRIAGILDQADALRRLRARALEKLNTLGQAVFQEMFGDVELTAELSEFIDPNRPITYGILKPGDDVEGGVPYIRVVDMKPSGIDIASIKRTTIAIAHEYRRSTLKKGDLLMSIRGHVGRTSIVPDELDGANITQDTARLAVPKDEALFFEYAIRSEKLAHWMRQRTKGAAVQGINLGDLKKLPIPLVDHAHRRLFTEKVADINSSLQCTRAALSKQHMLFASLQSAAFQGKL